MSVKKAAPAKTFNIYARGTFEASVEIQAETMEDAIAKARELKIDDFIKFTTECVDHDHRITGVFEN